MPELPEVETVRRGLEPLLLNHIIARIHVRRRDLRFPLPDDFEAVLTGRTITRMERRGKYMLFTATCPNKPSLMMLWHLGMSGRVRTFAGTADATHAPLDTHDHIIITTHTGASLRYNDARRFGFMDVFRTRDAATHPRLKDLGPEPTQLTEAGLYDALRRRRAPLKTVLLNQRVVAGLGNIYVAEILHRARLSPFMQAHRTTKKQAATLVQAIHHVLQEAIHAGGSTLKDHQQPSGEMGYFQHAFQVYARAGEACLRCGAPHIIRHAMQAGRSTFWCPACVKA